MWDWKLAEFHSFTRHVEFNELQAQITSRIVRRELRGKAGEE